MSSVKEQVLTSQLPLLETHMILQHVLGVSRAWLIAHDNDDLADHSLALIKELINRRLAGEPMAYILGHKEFYGHAFYVSDAVLVPRPETELLVDLALDFVKDKTAPKILDLGTGSGAIAISIALARPDAIVTATDFSADALNIARKNAQNLGAKLSLYEANWYDTGLDKKLSLQGFDLIVTNPPYVSEDDDHLTQGDLRFEPKMALTDYADGLSAIRHIIQHAPSYLKANGALFIEHGWDQAAAVREILVQHEFNAIQSKTDLAGIERITFGHYSA